MQEAKSSLRESVLARREAMDSRARVDKSRDIMRTISGLESYLGSGVVLAYAGFGSELQTDGFLRRTLELGKILVLPRVNRETKSLDIYEVRDPERDLTPGAWGIREPDPERCAPADLRSVDFVLVPGVAFDVLGGRLGYGAGFYDRLLSADQAAEARLVAGAFEIQMVDEVPMTELDVFVDMVVTEKGRYPAETPRT